jgi:hypothetical protein
MPCFAKKAINRLPFFVFMQAAATRDFRKTVFPAQDSKQPAQQSEEQH